MAEGITGHSLAGLFDLDMQSIRKLSHDGIVIRAGVRGRYLLAPSVRNYIRHLREIAAGRQGNELNAVDENARLKIAQRRNYDLKNAVLDGQTIPKEDVIAAWGAIVRNIRGIALSIPLRCKQDLPHLRFDDIEKIRMVIRELLTEAKGVLPDSAPIPKTRDLEELAAE